MRGGSKKKEGGGLSSTGRFEKKDGGVEETEGPGGEKGGEFGQKVCPPVRSLLKRKKKDTRFFPRAQKGVGNKEERLLKAKQKRQGNLPSKGRETIGGGNNCSFGENVASEKERKCGI